MALCINRCYCFQQTFAELKKAADRYGLNNVQALQSHMNFGHQCKLCHPYVRRMLRTGQTAFAEIITDEDEPLWNDPEEQA